MALTVLLFRTTVAVDSGCVAGLSPSSQGSNPGGWGHIFKALALGASFCFVGRIPIADKGRIGDSDSPPRAADYHSIGRNKNSNRKKMPNDQRNSKVLSFCSAAKQGPLEADTYFGYTFLPGSTGLTFHYASTVLRSSMEGYEVSSYISNA
ncbi:uncharacterized protein N7479_003544 [Penicillium vulpinum]|uniref:uncharacterized protein n=1 Tax=Penicillium vulpinum TaxID=29845 RepID=UPI002548AE49|nr:uncharacterized protein N7479_003544 [Penicillium vulpinum]KAJ5963668.1 hypothetical protein N7479_003544 [Penicillium vulpinum]